MNHIRTKLLSALTLSSLLLLTACNTVVVQDGGGIGTGGGGSNGPIHVDPYKRAWYDVYGTQCISYGYPMSGCNFYADGSKIRSNQDPYYTNLTLNYDYWTYTDSYGFRRTFLGHAWLSSTGILYDGFGNALNEIDEAELQSADVISIAASKEEEMAVSVGKQFADRYALNESNGITIAKTLKDWAVIGRDRSRTVSDIDAFSKRLYGVDLNKAKTAILEAVKGNQEELKEVNIDVAAHWGTSPETSKAILTKWYREELSSLGVK